MQKSIDLAQAVNSGVAAMVKVKPVEDIVDVHELQPGQFQEDPGSDKEHAFIMEHADALSDARIHILTCEPESLSVALWTGGLTILSFLLGGAAFVALKN